jgi:hypothetical protein
MIFFVAAIIIGVLDLFGVGFEISVPVLLLVLIAAGLALGDWQPPWPRRNRSQR